MGEDKPYMLSNVDRRLIVIALQGLAMRQGPKIFAAVEKVARKIDGEALLKEYLKDWLGFYGGKGE